jgi:molecular chaperone DnaJ
MADYYTALGVARDATTQDIKRAFRRIARESHPDANPGDAQAEERFRRAAEAYEVLSDPQRRAAYDRGDVIDLGDLFSSFAGVEDLLNRFFGSGFGDIGRPHQRRARGGDIGVEVTVTLREAAEGTRRELTYPAAVACEECGGSGAAAGTTPDVCARCNGEGSIRVTRQTLLGTAMSIATCDRCAGRGRVVVDACPVCAGHGSVSDESTVAVDIPPGVEDGTRLRVSGSGHAGGAGERAGDLFVTVRVEDDPRFERHGPDLVHRATIGLAEAALGTSVEIPIVDADEPETLDLAAGTQPGTVFRLARLGMPRLGRRGRGDLLVEVLVEVPTSLSAAQEEALRAYAAASSDSPHSPRDRRRRRRR